VGRCLADSRMAVLAVLADANGPLGTPDIAWVTGLSKSSASQAIHDALRHGVLRKEGRRYRLGGRTEALRGLLCEYARYDNGRMASGHAPDSVVPWQLGPDFIVATGTRLPEGFAHPTGTTAFSMNGMRMLGDRLYYHVTARHRALRPEDHAVDNILVGPGNVSHLTNSLVYLKRNGRRADWRYVDRLCRVYGLGGLGHEMALYLRRGRGTLAHFPSDEEFNEKMALYGGDMPGRST
jgi:hypothetical protein